MHYTGHPIRGVLAVTALCLPATFTSARNNDPVLSWLEEVRPELERAFGTPPPQFCYADAAPPSAPDLDVAAFVRWRFPHLRGGALTRAVHDATQAEALPAVARRGGDGVIVICPKSQSVLARWNEGLAPAARPDFLKLAAVHEAARRSVKAKHGLEKRRAECRDEEEWLALHAVGEGQAMALTRQVARAHGLEPLLPLLTRRYLHVPDANPDPALRAVSQAALRHRHWAATQGLAFLDHLEAQKINDVEAVVFVRPPRQVRLLQRPELYVRGLQSDRPELAAVLAKVEPALPPADWLCEQQPWTPAMVGQVAALLGARERAARVLETWDDGRTLVWTNKGRPGIQVGLSVARHETAAAARAYFGFVLELQRKRDELSNNPCGLPFKVVESRSRAASLACAEEAVQAEKKLQAVAGGKELVPMHILLARSGDRVAEITWHGTASDPAWAEAVLTAVFADFGVR